MFIWRGPATLLARFPFLLMGWRRVRKAGRASVPGAAALAALGIGSMMAATVLAAPDERVRGYTTLPLGTDLGEDSLEPPRELFHSLAAGGSRPDLAKLGNLLFSAPGILGPTARQAGISCETCHAGGASNPRLYIPGLSSKPGTFDTTSALFNPMTDDGRLGAVRVPSLRGARFLGPYGHDGRTASLREFVRDVIVKEFAGPEPAPESLDALVAYIQDIDFLPNPRLGPGGRLAAGASAEEKRGEALFNRPFPRDPGMSCAACHQPSAGFTDHRVHDVSTGGFERTPTLLGANFSAPYFHDGRYNSYDEVVEHFDRTFDLRLIGRDRRDLVAYLKAVGDAWNPYEPPGVDSTLGEFEDFGSVLARAVGEHDVALVALAVDTLDGELRELIERFPDRKNTAVTAGKDERARARGELRKAVLDLRRIEVASSAGSFNDATAALTTYRRQMDSMLPALYDAELYSLFRPENRNAYLTALKSLQQGTQP